MQKLLELSSISMEEILKFLEGRQDQALPALQALQFGDGGIGVFKSIFEVLAVKEEIKPPKKLKKGTEPPPPPPENLELKRAQSLSLRCIYFTVLTLYVAAENFDPLKKEFSKIPTGLTTLIEKIDSLQSKLSTITDDSSKVGVVQECIFALMSLQFMLKWDNSEINGDNAAVLARSVVALAKDKYLLVYCAQILETLSFVPAAKERLIEEELLKAQEQVMTAESKVFIDLAAAAAVPAGKGGKEAPKKEEKPKKGAPVVEAPVDPFEKLVRVPIDPKRQSAAVVKLLSRAMINLIRHSPSLVPLDLLTSYASCAAKLTLNSFIGELVREVAAPPLDVPLGDLVDTLCELLGTFAMTSNEARLAVCQAEGLGNAMAVMLQSKAIVLGAEGVSPKLDVTSPGGTRVTRLRRIAEKTVLHLLTTSREAASELPLRWISCKHYATDTTLLTAPVIAQIVESITASSSSDDDLANRGVRILAALLSGVELLEPFVAQSNLVGLAGAKISAVIQERCASVAEFQLKDFKAALGTDNAAEQQTGTAESLDALVPSIFEGLTDALIVLDQLVRLSVDAIKIFGTADRIRALANVLLAAGPVKGRRIGDFGCELETGAAECSVRLYDARNLPFAPAEGAVCDQILLRPLICDICASIAAADKANRAYEEALPAKPCQLIPSSKGPCEEASLLVCKVIGDAVCSILASQGQHKFTAAELMTSHPSGFKLDVSMLNAALGVLTAIGSCGVLGVMGCVEGIADNGFKHCPSAVTGKTADNPLLLCSSLATVTNFLLQESCLDVAGVPKDFAWKRSQFFDELFPSTSLSLTKTAIASVPQLFPFIALQASLLGVLADPDLSSESSSLALAALAALTRVEQLEDSSQPVVVDALIATFLQLGGGAIVAGLVGRFGVKMTDDVAKQTAVDHLSYLLGRGNLRESSWMQWVEANREEVVIDPKTGKPIPKKDDKKKDAKPEKKVDPKAPIVVPVVQEVALNLESTEAQPDPNRGPSRAFWNLVLNSAYHDPHTHSTGIPVVSGWIQSSLPSVALQLMDYGVDVNAVNEAGIAPLAFALLFCEEAVATQLIEHGCDVDMLDGGGNPLITYAMLSLHAEDLADKLSSRCSSPWNTRVELFGSPLLLPAFLSSKVDVNVRDVAGNSALLMSLGLGETTVVLGGYSVHISNSSYNAPEKCSRDAILASTNQLLERGTLINSANVKGQIPFHVAAARGDSALLKVLFDRGSIPSAQDAEGFLPLHYLAACCPEGAVDAFNTIMECAVHRPVERMQFQDHLTGRSEEEKDAAELDQFFQEAFTHAFCPLAAQQKRMHFADVLQLRTDDGMNIIQLAMCASSLLRGKFGAWVVGDKYARMPLLLHIFDYARNLDRVYSLQPSVLTTLLNYVSAQGMHVLHSACLLFEGITPQVALTDKEKRCKRIKYYPSQELNILDVIFSNYAAVGDVWSVNAVCSHPLVKGGVTIPSWTCWQAAVLNDNLDLAKTLVDKNADISIGRSVVHVLARLGQSTSVDMADFVVSQCASSAAYKGMLNEPCSLPGLESSRPIHLAIRYGSVALVKALLGCVKVDLNALDDCSKLSPIHEACIHPNTAAYLALFAECCDRVDLLLPAASGCLAEGTTCIDHALSTNNAGMLKQFIAMRKNDVMEHVLTERNGNPSILLSMETRHLQMMEALGIPVPVQPPLNGNEEPSDEQKDGAVEVVAEIETKLEDERLTPEFERHKEVLSLLLELVNAAGVLDESFHAHAMFASTSNFNV